MKIIMLAQKGDSTTYIYNALIKEFSISKIVIESSVSKRTLLKRRIKKYGWCNVFGQIIFLQLIVPVLKFASKRRKQTIISNYNLDSDNSYLDNENTIYVDSVNSDTCKMLITELEPDIIIVNGTRIISQEILHSTKAKFINMHAGITPAYRGCHGAYWAYYNGDDDNAGVTIHFIDEGIDTGNIIYQGRIDKVDGDNFTTYPLLQVGIGIPLEIQAINDVINKNVKTLDSDLPSGLYVHPTAWQYIKARFKKKVK